MKGPASVVSPFTFEEFGRDLETALTIAVTHRGEGSTVEKPCCIMTYPQEAK